MTVKKYYGIPRKGNQGFKMKHKKKLIHELKTENGFYFQIEKRGKIWEIYVSHEEYGVKTYCFGIKGSFKKAKNITEYYKKDYTSEYRERFIKKELIK